MNIESSYNYDKLGRLESVVFSNGAKATYGYDATGNRTTLVEVPAITPPPPPTPMAAGFGKRINGDFKNNAMLVELSGGELVGWGDCTTGVLANGVIATTDNLPQLLVFDPATTVPPPSATIVDWTYTNANLYVTYSNGWVYSAGQNSYGQLGHGDVVVRPFLKRIEYFAGLTISITKVWAGGGLTSTDGGGCVYFQDSNYNMYGCGVNTAGNLGNAATPTTNVSTPALCAGINATSGSHAIDVQCSFITATVSTYMLMSDGTLMVAGANTLGQLGINSTTGQSGTFVSAVNVSGNVANAIAISANSGSTTAANALYVDSSGKVWTTGYNGHGELALGNVTAVHLFTQVAALSNIVQAGLGGGLYGSGYAIDSSHKLYMWGYNGQSNLFLNNATTPQSTPVAPSAANLPSGIISKVFFAKGQAGLSTTPQTILLTTAGLVVYAGADNGQTSVPDASGAFNRLAMPQDLVDSTDTVVDLFGHGTGLTQRWFALTQNGNLYGCGQNADAICTGGFASNTAILNVQWQPVLLG
jgi:alpha-tubulin suppressor-like RCC1 family protein